MLYLYDKAYPLKQMQVSKPCKAGTLPSGELFTDRSVGLLINLPFMVCSFVHVENKSFQSSFLSLVL